MAVFVGGVIGIVVFYLLILAVGIWAARKKKAASQEGTETEEMALASRNIGWFVGPFTMIATWVGGGYINGTAEIVYWPGYGLAWAQAPFGYATSLFLGGLFFAKIMRDAEYVTMLDPFQRRYGNRAGGILYLPALCGEVFWSAAILSALGATISVVLDLDQTLSVIVSALIAVFYTLCGGLYSVAYTDIIQLVCIFFGLLLSIPFAASHEAVKSIGSTAPRWLGKMPTDNHLGYWIDLALLLICGGLPWQVYFQRVLSSKSAKRAQFLSITGSLGCIVSAIPAVIIGAIAASADWSMTEYNGENVFNNETNTTEMVIPPKQYPLVLPLVIRYLTPKAVSFFGLGAVAAAVMSSSDSSILSASSMFALNIYRHVIRPKASERELVWVIRGSIVGVGFLATLMALTVKSVYGLFLLCADLVFVILFPQLVLVVYTKFTNTYGSLAGYFVGLLIRVLGGEPLIGLKSTIQFPMYDNKNNADFQNFPFRTLAMLCSFFTIVTVSLLFNFLRKKGYFPDKYDVFNCFANEGEKSEMIKMNVPTKNGPPVTNHESSI